MQHITRPESEPRANVNRREKIRLFKIDHMADFLAAAKCLVRSEKLLNMAALITGGDSGIGRDVAVL